MRHRLWLLGPLLGALLALPLAVQAGQRFASPAIVDETDEDVEGLSEVYIEQGGNSIYWFELDVTAIDTGSVQFYIQYQNPQTDAWATWISATAVSTVSAQQVCISTLEITALPTNACDLTVELPMPSVWRVRIFHASSAVATYTVSHWRY